MYKIDAGNHAALSATIGTATDSRTCNINGASNLVVGDFIVSKGAAITEGDVIRGGHAIIELVNSSQSSVELYAINAVIKESNLHNDK